MGPPPLDQVHALGPVAAQRREHEFPLRVGVVRGGERALAQSSRWVCPPQETPGLRGWQHRPPRRAGGCGAVPIAHCSLHQSSGTVAVAWPDRPVTVTSSDVASGCKAGASSSSMSAWRSLELPLPSVATCQRPWSSRAVQDHCFAASVKPGELRRLRHSPRPAPEARLPPRPSAVRRARTWCRRVPAAPRRLGRRQCGPSRRSRFSSTFCHAAGSPAWLRHGTQRGRDPHPEPAGQGDEAADGVTRGTQRPDRVQRGHDVRDLRQVVPGNVVVRIGQRGVQQPVRHRVDHALGRAGRGSGSGGRAAAGAMAGQVHPDRGRARAHGQLQPSRPGLRDRREAEQAGPVPIAVAGAGIRVHGVGVPAVVGAGGRLGTVKREPDVVRTPPAHGPARGVAQTSRRRQDRPVRRDDQCEQLDFGQAAARAAGDRDPDWNGEVGAGWRASWLAMTLRPQRVRHVTRTGP